MGVVFGWVSYVAPKGVWVLCLAGSPVWLLKVGVAFGWVSCVVPKGVWVVHLAGRLYGS